MTGPATNAAFGQWYALPAFAEHIIVGPGVFQIRVADGLIDYPRGKSAMIYYGVGAQLARAVDEFWRAQQARRSQQAATWLCRHTIEFDGGRVMDAERLYERLLAQFVSRFGSEPVLPCD